MPDHRDLLAACLAEIEAGTSSIEECAARYPEMTGLADQLRMALALREMPPVTMPEVRKMALERRLLQVMDARAPRRSLVSTLRPLLTVAALLVVLSLAAFGVARASHSSLPGDFLYSYKRGVEQVELSFAGASRPVVLTSMAESRLHELESVVIRDQRVDDDFVDEVTSAVNEAMRATSDPVQQTALYTKALNTYQFAASQGIGRVALATLSLVTPEPTTSSPVVINPTPSMMPSATVESATETATPEATVTPLATNTATIAATEEPPTQTSTQTDQPVAVATSTPSVTPSATSTTTPSGSGLVTATALPSFTPSSTPTPTLPTDTPTITDEPTETPVVPTLMYPTVTPTLTATFTPIGGNITIVPPTPVPPTSASGGATAVPPTSAPTDSPTITLTATTDSLLPCPTITPTPTEQLVDGATVTPSPTATLAEDGSNQPAQAPTEQACATITPTPTIQPTEQTPAQ